MRERMEEHRKNPVCASCHKIMDPIGFSLENFDLTGKWRTTDRSAPDRCVRRLSGRYEARWTGESSRRSADISGAFVRTVTAKLMTYAVGRAMQYYDMPAVRAISRQAALEDFRFSSLVVWDC